LSKKAEKRYKKTTVKTKRYVIRSLNTFSKQYKVACVKYVDLKDSNELIQVKVDKLNPLIIYFDEKCDSCSDLRQENEVSGVIWDCDVEKNNLSSYLLVIEEVDNLISINKKHTYKASIRKIIRKMVIHNFEEEEKWKTIFFEPRYIDSVILEIEEELKLHNEKKEHNHPREYKNLEKNHLLHVESKTYKTLATKIYTQLKNRVRFSNVGIYNKNDSINKQSNILTPIFITSYEKLKSRLDYLLGHEWLFSESILSVLKSKLKVFEEQDDIAYKIKELDILDNISLFYNIALYDTKDNEYIDAIELLKFYYLEEINASHKYGNPYYRPYKFELLSKMTINWKETDAIEYIKSFNKLNNYDDSYDFVENTFNEEQAQEQFNQLYNYPIDAETFNDNSIDSSYRETASSIDMQWDKYYDILVEGILSKDVNKNRYYQMCEIAKELLREFNRLEADNIFSTDTEYKSKIMQKLKQDLAIKFKNLVGKKKQKKINTIISIKKKEWKLLNEVITSNYGLFQALEDFDYKRLKFKECY